MNILLQLDLPGPTEVVPSLHYKLKDERYFLPCTTPSEHAISTSAKTTTQMTGSYDEPYWLPMLADPFKKSANGFAQPQTSIERSQGSAGRQIAMASRNCYLPAGQAVGANQCSFLSWGLSVLVLWGHPMSPGGLEAFTKRRGFILPSLARRVLANYPLDSSLSLLSSS